jgi:hypothetical protein
MGWKEDASGGGGRADVMSGYLDARTDGVNERGDGVESKGCFELREIVRVIDT